MVLKQNLTNSIPYYNDTPDVKQLWDIAQHTVRLLIIQSNDCSCMQLKFLMSFTMNNFFSSLAVELMELMIGMDLYPSLVVVKFQQMAHVQRTLPLKILAMGF